ncbi:hypothetical protein K0M31_002060 [Melipona bicolor]|uniref:Uncharacterized protein n=1 Tax=Melipona bicolor TaxID=60889 RepID=A0AA40KYG4_9HYME|nr:hypothetical protein K0M31_002060 [Melipona bicolor]
MSKKRRRRKSRSRTRLQRPVLRHLESLDDGDDQQNASRSSHGIDHTAFVGGGTPAILENGVARRPSSIYRDDHTAGDLTSSSLTAPPTAHQSHYREVADQFKGSPTHKSARKQAVARASLAVGAAPAAKLDRVNSRRRAPKADRAAYVQRQLQFVRLVAGGTVREYEGAARNTPDVQRIPRPAQAYIQLLLLNLAGNRLGIDRVDETTFLGLIRLITLDLSYSALTRIDARTFRDVFFLQILDSRNNTIDRIESNAFLPLYNLHTFEPSENRLHKLGAQLFNGLFVLNRLTLSGNAIASVYPLAFRDCSNLKELDLRENELTTVSDAPRDLALLKTLDHGENLLLYNSSLTH